MIRIIIFAGTTEGRMISDALERAGVTHLVCVATETGVQMIPQTAHRQIHVGRLDELHMEELFVHYRPNLVIDATHPYATEVTENLRIATQNHSIPYERIVRDLADTSEDETGRIHYFDSAESCAKALGQTKGNILLTTGSKDLKEYCSNSDVLSRIYARIIPAQESLRLCEEAGLSSRQILAAIGPFSKEMNLAMIHEYEISTVVTKDSGLTGGFLQKEAAALESGCNLFVIGAPQQEEGVTVSDFLAKYDLSESRFQIYLCGIGMGNEESMTGACRDVIAHADVLFGASRMLQSASVICKKDAILEKMYLPEDIVPQLNQYYINHKSGKVAILFSGDSGFHSGAAKMYEALMQWKDDAESPEFDETIEVKVLPGISSIAQFASMIAVSYEDAAIESWHGRAIDECYPMQLAHTIERHRKTFILLSNETDVSRLGKLLVQNNLTECEIIFGGNLCYENQIIRKVSAQECANILDLPRGLYLAYVENRSCRKRLMQCYPDEAFLRDQVPMTKADVRHLCIAHLQLTEDAIVYDIGAGTGSVSIEIAKQHPSIRVYAVEQKANAVSLIQENCERFGCRNIQVIEGKAPDAMQGLPVPTHAFIGGSSGNLKEITERLYSLNPNIRIVITAVTIETVAAMTEVLKQYGTRDGKLIQIAISENQQAGNYTLMKANNPVYLASFTCEEK